jgi:hypothetical protein
VNTELVERVRNSLPPRLNAGILMGDGGFCILGWIILSAGYHPITIYGSTAFVNDPVEGGSAVDVVARLCGLDADSVRDLAELNDATPFDTRVEAVRAQLDQLLAGAPRPGMTSR